MMLQINSVYLPAIIFVKLIMCTRCRPIILLLQLQAANKVLLFIVNIFFMLVHFMISNTTSTYLYLSSDLLHSKSPFLPFSGNKKEMYRPKSLPLFPNRRAKENLFFWL